MLTLSDTVGSLSLYCNYDHPYEVQCTCQTRIRSFLSHAAKIAKLMLDLTLCLFYYARYCVSADLFSALANYLHLFLIIVLIS